MSDAAIGINPSQQLVKLELTKKEAQLFYAALSLGAKLIDESLPEPNNTIGFDDLSNDIKIAVSSCMILDGCAKLINDQIEKIKD